jgi:hypothetical protein
MRERDARDILLVKAIEESDRAGQILPLADRAAATREVLRAHKAARPGAAHAGIDRATSAVLAERARRLLGPLEQRHPFLRGLLRTLDGSIWYGALVLALGLVVGLGLSALDGSSRIDVLGLPLIALVAWNLLVYAALIAGVLWRRWRGREATGASLYAWSVGQQARRLLRGVSRFDTRLTEALQRFAGDWLRVERPRLIAKGERLLHLGAAAVALGLVAGLYFRGVVRGYRAGWDSTWPDLVPTFVHALYGAAARITGIALPEGERLAAMRWSSGAGEAAAPWIHLIAVTALVYIVVPRLVLAAAASWRVWFPGMTHALPASLGPYARGVLGAGQVGGGEVRVASYGYDLAPEAEGALRRLLPAALGEGTTVAFERPAAYGAEDEALARLGATLGDHPTALALVMSLASTPEDENHGALLAGVRDLLARSPQALPWVFLVDEGPYAQRMAGAPERLEERRRLWSAFARARGLRASFVDLRPSSEPATQPAAEPAAIEALRAGLMAPRADASW